jgi:hypothetical protein
LATEGCAFGHDRTHPQHCMYLRTVRSLQTVRSLMICLAIGAAVARTPSLESGWAEFCSLSCHRASNTDPVLAGRLDRMEPTAPPLSALRVAPHRRAVNDLVAWRHRPDVGPSIALLCHVTKRTGAAGAGTLQTGPSRRIGLKNSPHRGGRLTRIRVHYPG